MTIKKKIDVAQLGKVNSAGSRLLGSAASMTLNKPALPDRTPNRTAGCRVQGGPPAARMTRRKQKTAELLGGDAEAVSSGLQVSTSQR